MAVENESKWSDRRLSSDRGHVLIAAVLFEAALAPIALFLGWLFDVDPFANFAWDSDAVADGILATGPMLILLWLGLYWPIRPLQRIKQILKEMILPLIRDRPVSDLALLAISAGIGEELLFRGLIQEALGHYLGIGGGLLVASLLFGLLHPITFAYVIIAAVLGAYLGWIWIITGNLLTAMVAHALYDFIALRLLLQEDVESARDED